MSYFFVQGISAGCYDIAGNKIILGLWKGLSNAPINAQHAGYGLGAIIAVQIAKPFIRFNPLEMQIENSSNFTSILTNDSSKLEYINSSDSSIEIPYYITAGVGFLVAFLFVIAQIFEQRNTKKFDFLSDNTNNNNVDMNLLDNKDNFNSERETNTKLNFFIKIFFDDKHYQGSSLAYMVIQLILNLFILFFIQGYQIILSTFMITYLTRGPVKFSVRDYSIIQTLFWSLYVLSRFISAFAAYKMNPIKFVLALLGLNLITNTFFIFPFFASNYLFYWFSISLIGLLSGPCNPSSLMAGKLFLNDYNSFILSLLISSSGLGSIFFQKVIGDLLDSVEPKKDFLGYDHFEAPYLISHILFISSLVCFCIFATSSLIYRKFSHLIK